MPIFTNLRNERHKDLIFTLHASKTSTIPINSKRLDARAISNVTHTNEYLMTIFCMDVREIVIDIVA